MSIAVAVACPYLIEDVDCGRLGVCVIDSALRNKHGASDIVSCVCSVCVGQLYVALVSPAAWEWGLFASLVYFTAQRAR